jgi:hypothetical protein
MGCPVPFVEQTTCKDSDDDSNDNFSSSFSRFILPPLEEVDFPVSVFISFFADLVKLVRNIARYHVNKISVGQAPPYLFYSPYSRFPEEITLRYLMGQAG